MFVFVVDKDYEYYLYSYWFEKKKFLHTKFFPIS